MHPQRRTRVVVSQSLQYGSDIFIFSVRETRTTHSNLDKSRGGLSFWSLGQIIRHPEMSGAEKRPE